MRLKFQRLARIHTVLKRILIFGWRTRALCTTKQLASLFAADYRRPTRRTFPGFCPATKVLLHLAVSF